MSEPCPITRETPSEPVVICPIDQNCPVNGKVYEKEAISKWLNEKHTDPLDRRTFAPNTFKLIDHPETKYLYESRIFERLVSDFKRKMKQKRDLNKIADGIKKVMNEIDKVQPTSSVKRQRLSVDTWTTADMSTTADMGTMDISHSSEIQDNSHDLEIEFISKSSFLGKAAWYGDLDQVQTCLDLGIDPMSRNRLVIMLPTKNGMFLVRELNTTPIILATIADNLEIVKLLLHSCEITMKDFRFIRLYNSKDSHSVAYIKDTLGLDTLGLEPKFDNTSLRQAVKLWLEDEESAINTTLRTHYVLEHHSGN